MCDMLRGESRTGEKPDFSSLGENVGELAGNFRVAQSGQLGKTNVRGEC